MDARVSLSVIMPVYNEAERVAAAIAQVFERGRPDQLVVVDDGSTDETAARVTSSPYAHRLELLRHPVNRGKTAAIRSAIPLLRGDAVIIQDGDLEYDPADYERLLALMQSTGSPVVYGSRYLSPLNAYSTLGFYAGGRLLSFLSNLLFGLQITDEPTCYKLLRRSLLEQIPLRGDRFEFCAEVTGFLGRLGVCIPEIPIGYIPRTMAQGKKIRPHDGWDAARTLWRYRAEPLEALLAAPRGHPTRPDRAPSLTPEPMHAPATDATRDLLLLELVDRLQMKDARNYVRWMLERFAPYLGDRVLELSAGIGLYTLPLLQAGKQVTSCESNPECARILAGRVGHSGRFALVAGELGDGRTEPRLDGQHFDSVLCGQALAVCEDPTRLLAAAYDRLRPGGRLLLFVPAVRRAYGSLDRSLGHRRRFDRADLQRLLTRRPWRVEFVRYTNPVGLLGWLANGIVLARERQSPAQIVAFDRLAVPVLRALERHVPMPLGQSLLAVARK